MACYFQQQLGWICESPLNGTEGNDSLRGSNLLPTYIYEFGGNDIIVGY